MVEICHSSYYNSTMNWVPIVNAIIAKLPIDRLFSKERSEVEKLEKLKEILGSSRATESQKEGVSKQKTTPTITQEPETALKQEAVATACVPCAVGHFSTSAGLLNEAVRFKGEGITSDEILNRIAIALQEQNTLERVDLAPERIESVLPWEREIAEEALNQSRSLRHRLETLSNIEQLEKAAADSERVYKKLFREWFKQRFAHLGPEKAQRIANEVGKLSLEDKERVLKRPEELEMTLEEAKKLAADEAAKEVEARWH